MTETEILIDLPGYQITGIERVRKTVRISLRYSEPSVCPHCGAAERRSKGWHWRGGRHEDWGLRPVLLDIHARKWLCKGCGHQYRDRLPGILRSQRASEAFQQSIYEAHLDGINRSRLGRRKGIGATTFERYFQHGLQRQFAQWHPLRCPSVLGIDEHFFTRRKGYATTFCDLKNHKIYDVVLGRTEVSLDAYLQRLEGKSQVRVVCMELASTYRSIARKHFANAVLVADRFHVIRLINHHLLACWRELDPIVQNIADCFR